MKCQAKRRTKTKYEADEKEVDPGEQVGFMQKGI